MATIAELKKKIEALEKGLKNKALKTEAKAKIRVQVAKLNAQIKDMKKSKPVSSAKAVAARVRQNKNTTSKRQDGERPAKPVGRRVSDSGNTYYEYRSNRTDVKQPSKKVPVGSRFEDGGMIKKVSDGEDTFYLTYIDPTHFYLSNSPDFKGSAYHVGQFRSRPFYEEVRSWLKTHKSEYANGGMMGNGGMTYAQRSSYDSIRIAKSWQKVLDSNFDDKEYEKHKKLVEETQIPKEQLDNIQYYISITPKGKRRDIDYIQYWSKNKMADGGMMAKGGEIVPYVLWVSKDGDERVLYGKYKSQRAAEMAMKKLWDSGEDYHSMGNMPLSRYEKNGFYDNGGMMNISGESNGDWVAESGGAGMYADGGSLDLLATTAGTPTTNTGGTTFSNADLSGIFAKGGLLQHGLRIGDVVQRYSGNSIVVFNKFTNEYFDVDLNKGERIIRREYGGSTEIHRTED